MINKLQ